MTKEELKEHYKKNKVVVFGIGVIIAIFLFKIMVPTKQEQEKRKKAAAMIVETPKTKNTPPTQEGPISPPIPLQQVNYQPLSDKIKSRFSSNQVYKYSKNRNIFIPISKQEMVTIQENGDAGENFIERPNVTYHGFFIVGNNKVAILRYSNELILTRSGSILKKTPFILTSVLPEKIIITDKTNLVKEFEISLSENFKEER